MEAGRRPLIGRFPANSGQSLLATRSHKAVPFIHRFRRLDLLSCP